MDVIQLDGDGVPPPIQAGVLNDVVMDVHISEPSEAAIDSLLDTIAVRLDNGAIADHRAIESGKVDGAGSERCELAPAILQMQPIEKQSSQPHGRRGVFTVENPAPSI